MNIQVDLGPIRLVNRGAWDSSYTYELLNAVRYENGFYICQVDRSLGDTPSPTSAVWALIATDGANGTDGVDGEDGKDGVSPTIDVATTPTGTTVTLTDANGTKSFTVNNGTNGQDGTNGTDGTNGEDGKDGVSPTIDLDDIEQGTVVTITDVEGQHSFTILNGTDGKDGKDGVDGTNGKDGTNGVSPTVDVSTNTQASVVTITDVNGAKSFTITNGTNGQDGEDGKDGTDGENGATFTPAVDDKGNLTWTNDKGLSNPTAVNIKGEQGDEGFSPLIGVTSYDDRHVVVITGKDTSNTFTVLNGTDGQDGAPGAPGEPGKTPVKGEDYCTEEDKEELVQRVIEALPKYTEELF